MHIYAGKVVKFPPNACCCHVEMPKRRGAPSAEAPPPSAAQLQRRAEELLPGRKKLPIFKSRAELLEHVA